MDGERLADLPMRTCPAAVVTTAFDPDREFAWAIAGRMGRALQPVCGYRMGPADGGAGVTSYCDWSNLREDYRPFLTFPIVPESALKGTLGILDRTVRRRRSRAGSSSVGGAA